VGFEPTRSVNPFRFSRPVPSATRRALHDISLQMFNFKLNTGKVQFYLKVILKYIFQL